MATNIPGMNSGAMTLSSHSGGGNYQREEIALPASRDTNSRETLLEIALLLDKCVSRVAPRRLRVLVPSRGFDPAGRITAIR
jgi:hypothetical protein